ncbi:MAG: hypothetical protein AAF790_07330 [Planctomycetota bacterium]
MSFATDLRAGAAPAPGFAAAAQTPGKSLPSEDREAQVLWRLRWTVARTQLRQLLTDARLRTSLVVCLSLGFWLGLFVLFHQGFAFLVYYVGQPGGMAHAEPVRLIFHVFFASLNVMLIFSSGIILYGGLFSSAETRFLLTQPIRPERIVLHKFQEAVLFSSWGFLLLASPLTVAYGIVVHAPWYYFALVLPLICAFVYIPCGIGALLCLLLVYRLNRVKVALVASVAAASVVAAGWSVWRTIVSPQAELFGAEWFHATMKRFEVTEQEWLPSTWLSNSLLEAALPWPTGVASSHELPVVQSCLYLVVMASNALLLHVLTVAAGKRWLRPAFSALECRPRRRRATGVALVDRLAQSLLRPFPQQMRLLLLKDWRLLRRDPVQWSQFLIFFGLLGLYFVNIDRFRNTGNDLNYRTWVNMVSFLNLAVVGLILSTFTTRFIFPMISLEGRRFWVLGLMPIRRETIVWSKFAFAALGSWAPCALLILLSDLMLRVSIPIIAVHQFTNVLLCSGLAAMAVGLGASMPNFREPAPSKIAAGFGGTLNLVLSALYIMAIVVMTALPCHFFLLASSQRSPVSFFNPDYLRVWLIVGTGLAVLTGAAATVLPLRAGIRTFNRLEFY